MFARTLKGITFALFCCAIFPINVFASSELLFTPASGSFKVDEKFSARIITQSPDKLSAVEASVEFDPKMLSVKVLKSSGDVSWVITPNVDSEKGELHFSGIVAKDAPLSIELAQIEVTGLRPGKPELRFVSGASTVAADGTGGNTLGKITHAAFDIVTDSDTSLSNGEVLGVNDSVLSVSSPQIQDENSWYALRDVILNWVIPFDVKDLLIGITKKKEDVGYKLAPNGTTTREIKDLEDGEWYFHLTPKGKGVKDTIHFRLGIDNEAPEIATTTEVERADKRDPNITYYIEAKDKTSGISHFEISQNNGTSVRWEDDGTHEYKFRAGGLGDQDLTISVFDKASNRSESHVRFNVEALENPELKLIRTTIPEASPIVAEIKGLPNAIVVVTFEGGVVHHDDTINLDGNGKATYVLKESVLPGGYQISAIQKLENGASSKSGNRIDVEVSPSIIGYIGRNLAISIVVIPILLFGILYIVWRFWFIPFYRKKINRERVIQKVAPLALMEGTSNTKNTPNKRVQSAPLEIRRVVRVNSNPNTVVDLRRK